MDNGWMDAIKLSHITEITNYTHISRYQVEQNPIVLSLVIHNYSPGSAHAMCSLFLSNRENLSDLRSNALPA